MSILNELVDVERLTYEEEGGDKGVADLQFGLRMDTFSDKTMAASLLFFGQLFQIFSPVPMTDKTSKEIKRRLTRIFCSVHIAPQPF